MSTSGDGGSVGGAASAAGGGGNSDAGGLGDGGSVNLAQLQSGQLQQIGQSLEREIEQVQGAVQQLSQVAQRWSTCRSTAEQLKQQLEQRAGKQHGDNTGGSAASESGSGAGVDRRRESGSGAGTQSEALTIGAGAELFVPLTGSVYVPGRVRDPACCLVDVGTGYYAEKTPEEARAFYERKLKTATDGYKSAESALGEKRKQLEAVHAVLRQKSAPGSADASAQQ